MSERDYTKSAHYILSKTLETEAINKDEAEALAKYKELVSIRDKELEKLDALKEKRDVTDEYNHSSNLIQIYNAQIRRLEETQALKNIVERHREKEIEKMLFRKETARLQEERRKRKEEQEQQLKLAQEELQRQKALERRQTYAQIKLLLMSLSFSLPLLIMGAPLWLLLIFTLLIFSPTMSKSFFVGFIVFCLYDIIRPILYVCGIVAAAQGPQDFVAIAFYIITALQSITIIKKFITTVLAIITILNHNKRS